MRGGAECERVYSFSQRPGDHAKSVLDSDDLPGGDANSTYVSISQYLVRNDKQPASSRSGDLRKCFGHTGKHVRELAMGLINAFTGITDVCMLLFVGAFVVLLIVGFKQDKGKPK